LLTGARALICKKGVEAIIAADAINFLRFIGAKIVSCKFRNTIIRRLIIYLAYLTPNLMSITIFASYGYTWLYSLTGLVCKC
jgi:hypothetical protein